MEKLLTQLEQHLTGLIALIIIAFSLVGMLNWVARIFMWGKYKNQPLGESQTTGYVIAKFFAAVINDFRHFLALILVAIFATLTIYSMTCTPNFKEKMDALQLVIASLGGLLGSIIGYYFGESAASSRQVVPTQPDAQSSEGDASKDDEEMKSTKTAPKAIKKEEKAAGK